MIERRNSQSGVGLIGGGEEQRSVPLVDLQAQYARLQSRIEDRLGRVLAHGRFILGPEVDELEAALAEFVGSRHAIAVASGTAALTIALMAERVGAGDAVFVPSFSFVATAEAVAVVRAEPVFVDSDPDAFNMDPVDLERRIARVVDEGRLRPRAVIAVDLFGLPADYPDIDKIARRYGLFVLADAAQSFGAHLGECRVGTLAAVTATSFYPSKPLGCYGDGGCIFTEDAERADLMRSIRQHGFGAAEKAAVHLGLNDRLDTMQAAILLAKLEVLESELAARRAIAERYGAALSDLVKVPAHPARAASAWAVYPILANRRDALCEALTAQGIGTKIYYSRPIHLQPFYARYGEGPGSLPVADMLSQRVLALPMHPYLEPATVHRICGAVAQALR